MDNVKTGGLIKSLRKEKGMTQKELAGLLHLTDRAVSKWERGLCAPDLSVLEPLAEVLGVSITELISGERMEAGRPAEELETTARAVIRYSEAGVVQRLKAWKRRLIAGAVLILAALFLAVPTLNGLIGGNGFAWICLPACARAREAARGIAAYDGQAILASIHASEAMPAALSALREEGVEIRDWQVRPARTHLEDGFLIVEAEFSVLHGELTYQVTCTGTYRDGKIGFYQLFPGGARDRYPDWMLRLEDALCTESPG